MPVAAAPSGGIKLSTAPAHPHLLDRQGHMDTKKAAQATYRKQQGPQSLKALSSRYLFHSQCVWSSPQPPSSKLPLQVQQPPGGWGPLRPPSSLLPDNIRDIQWWQ